MTDRIVVDSKIHFGKPCVAGTRITVQNVLELLDENLLLIRLSMTTIQISALKISGRAFNMRLHWERLKTFI